MVSNSLMSVGDDLVKNIVVMAVVGSFEVGAVLIDEEKDERESFACDEFIPGSTIEKGPKLVDEVVFKRGEGLVGIAIMTVKGRGVEVGGVTDILDPEGDGTTPEQGTDGGLNLAFAFLVAGIGMIVHNPIITDFIGVL